MGPWAVDRGGELQGVDRDSQGCRGPDSQSENSQRKKKFIYSQPWVKGLAGKKKKVLEMGIA